MVSKPHPDQSQIIHNFCFFSTQKVGMMSYKLGFIDHELKKRWKKCQKKVNFQFLPRSTTSSWWTGRQHKA